MRAVQGLLPALSHVPDLPEGSRAQGTDTGADKGQLVNYSERKMAMTDPIADMLTRIRNAAQARHESVDAPWSRVKEQIVKVLVAEGYLQEFKKVKAKNRAGEDLRIQLRFDKEHKPVISGLKRVSKPSIRVYVGFQEIPPIRHRPGYSA